LESFIIGNLPLGNKCHKNISKALFEKLQLFRNTPILLTPVNFWCNPWRHKVVSSFSSLKSSNNFRRIPAPQRKGYKLG
jgi:hypothetical protein